MIPFSGQDTAKTCACSSGLSTGHEDVSLGTKHPSDSCPLPRIWISPVWTCRKRDSNRPWPSKPRSGYQNWISKNGSSQVLARHFRPNLTYSEKLSEPDWNRTGQASAPHLRRPRTSPKGLEGDLNQQKAFGQLPFRNFAMN